MNNDVAIGIGIGMLLGALYLWRTLALAERRHRDELSLVRKQSRPHLEGPAPHAPVQYVGAADPGQELQGNSMWMKHSEYHWTAYMNGELLQYWPTAGKFRYQGRSYVGGAAALDQFIKERVTQAGENSHVQ